MIERLKGLKNEENYNGGFDFACDIVTFTVL